MTLCGAFYGTRPRPGINCDPFQSASAAGRLCLRHELGQGAAVGGDGRMTMWSAELSGRSEPSSADIPRESADFRGRPSAGEPVLPHARAHWGRLDASGGATMSDETNA
jgi:hypothetical protein